MKRSEIKRQIIEATVDKIDFSNDIKDSEVYEYIDDVLLNLPERKYYAPHQIKMLREEVFSSLKKLDILQEYLDDDEITEIMINGPDDIYIEKDGSLFKTEKSFESKSKLDDLIQQIVAGCNRSVNEANPIVDARLSTGERVNIVLSPVALNGPIVTIRRFPKEPMTMARLQQIGSISFEALDFLRRLVIARYNIFISGGTGSGKTTFLNALSQFIPPDERIITIEDSAELNIIGAENIVRLETRNANFDECVPITIRDLIKTSLRMRPERIIVGEVRGAEALDMLQAMNTGHDGSLSTGHANSTKDMISRLETMVLMGMELPLLAVRRQISSGIDVIVHLGRLRDKSRKVLEITEVVGMKEGEVEYNTLFSYEGGKLVKRNNLINDEKYLSIYSED